MCYLSLQIGILEGAEDLGSWFLILGLRVTTSPKHITIKQVISLLWASFLIYKLGQVLGFMRFIVITTIYYVITKYFINVVGRGNPPWALNIPACPYWLSSKCKPLTPLYLDYVSWLCFQWASLANEVTFPPKDSVTIVYYKNSDSPKHNVL